MHKTYELNKYIHAIDNEESVILYNSINGGIIEFDKNLYNRNYHEIEVNLVSDYEYLNSNKFLKNIETSDYVNDRIKFGYTSDMRTLNLIIELNRTCNLNCSYCYQRGTYHSNEISESTINSIFKYIEDVVYKGKKSKIRINFIGGEPFLSYDKLVYIHKYVYNLSEKNNLDCDFIINTNGTLLEKEKVKDFKKTSFAITLSLEDDHNRNRPSNKFNSYKSVINGIKSSTKYLNENENELTIRYNTNEDNILEFESFLNMLDKEGIKPVEITPMYTDEYENTDFKNKLSKIEFLKRNSSTAIDLMIKHGYNIYYSPKYDFSPCKAYFNDNFKFFVDGSVGICDASDQVEGLPNINNICSASELNEYYKELKSWNPLDDTMCSNCGELAMCGGKYFCRKDCDYKNRFILDIFIKTYLRHLKFGNRNKFPNIQ